jgi:hypothetical protein
MDAYNCELIPSVFGVSQVLTLVAQLLMPEERLDVERTAGVYLAALS